MSICIQFMCLHAYFCMEYKNNGHQTENSRKFATKNLFFYPDQKNKTSLGFYELLNVNARSRSCLWQAFMALYLMLFTCHIFSAKFYHKNCVLNESSRNPYESLYCIYLHDFQKGVKFTRIHITRLGYASKHRRKKMHAEKTWYTVILQDG